MNKNLLALALLLIATPAYAQVVSGPEDTSTPEIVLDRGNVYLSSGDLIMNTTGETIRVDSGTAASACKGTGTFNGTTAVVVSTTCAATSNMVILTPTSDPTGSTAAYCWHSATSNGVSFSVDCDQANDGTFNWLIVKEG